MEIPPEKETDPFHETESPSMEIKNSTYTLFNLGNHAPGDFVTDVRNWDNSMRETARNVVQELRAQFHDSRPG